jgi:hypothetical protein
MRPAPVGRILSRMDSRSITITLELDVAGESLTGSATDGTGAARTFSGWLGLVTAIDRLVSAHPTDARQEDGRD